MPRQYEIRRVDAGVALDLLPEASRSYLWSSAFRATEPGSEKTVGAALLAKMPTGTRVLLRSAEGCGDSRLEDLLLTAVIELAERRGAPGVIAWQSERLGSAEAELWLQRGFEPRNQRLIVEADAAVAVESCKAQMARVRKRVRIPADARVIPLREAPMAQVGRLKVLAFGGKPQDTIRRAQDDGSESFDPELSLAIMVGDKVAGIALGVTPDEHTLFGEAIAIDPAFRGRWALPLLKGEWFCKAFDRGIRRLQGEIAVTNAVSRKVFSRDGFEEVATLCDFVREIKSSAAVEPSSAKPTVVVTTAPGLDVSPLLRQLKENGVDGAPGTDEGLLTALPRRPDWWGRAAGRSVRMPFVLLNGLPDVGLFRIVVVVPEEKGPGAFHRAALRRAAAQLRLRPNCQVVELSQAAVDQDSAAACRTLNDSLSR